MIEVHDLDKDQRNLGHLAPSWKARATRLFLHPAIATVMPSKVFEEINNLFR